MKCSNDFNMACFSRDQDRFLMFGTLEQDINFCHVDEILEMIAEVILTTGGSKSDLVGFASLRHLSILVIFDPLPKKIFV